MTVFAYRFPLELVLRVFDIIIAEGIESLLRFAIAVLKKHESTIITLEFEALLEYLKTGLFDSYITNQNQFVQDALDVKITKKQLAKLAEKYEAELKSNDPTTILLENMKSQNKQLEETIKNLEKNMTVLNEEHIHLANELITTKLDFTRLSEENGTLARQVRDLQKAVDSADARREEAVQEVKKEVEAEKVDLVKRNEMLEASLREMEQTLIMTKLELANSETDRDTLARKLKDLKKALE